MDKTPGRAVALAMAILATTLSGAALYGQAQSPLPASLKAGRAVLVRGSVPVKGLPGFGLNALPGLSATYLYLPAGAETPLAINAWFSATPLPVPAGWTPVHCTGLPAGDPGPWTLSGEPGATAPPSGGGTRLILINGSTYSLLVGQPAAMQDPCKFLAILLDRFSFFYRYAQSVYEVSFPSVLEVGR